MAQIRSSRWWMTATAVLASAFLATVGVLVFWDWPGPPAGPYVAPERPAPTVSLTEAPPVVHPAPLAAAPLTAEALQGIDGEWILFEYDSSAVLPAQPSPGVTPSPAPAPTAAPVPDVDGPRYLYLADRTGRLYAAADLGVASDLRLLAWLPDRRTALVTAPVASTGPSPAPQDDDDGSVAIRTFDLITGELGDEFPVPPGRDTRGWTAPHVQVTRAGDGLLITEGPGSSRQLVSVGFGGQSPERLLGPVERGLFLEGEDDDEYVARERETLETVELRGDEIVDVSRETWSLASYGPPLPEPEPTVSPSPSASPSPAPEPEGIVRTEHFLPGGETRCTPSRWPADRQLLVLCDGGAGTATVYTFSPSTATFVLAATLRWDGSELLTMSPDGTRVFVGETMFDLFAEPRWSVDLAGGSAPARVTWAGQYAVLAGDAERAQVPATALAAHDRSTGRVAYVVSAHEGAVGFGTVLGASAAGD